VVELLERDGEPLALGRKRRTVSPALRRALAARDRGCRFPGCDATRFVEAHHVEHWAFGGETNLSNLILLCHRHHRLVHERGYTLRDGGDGEPRFVNEYGVAIPSVPRPPPPSDRDGLRRRQRRLAIDAGTCWTGTGDRMDLGLAVDALIAITTAPAAA
jgi:5-methylcytosine-specific restriction endonuclease McrA